MTSLLRFSALTSSRLRTYHKLMLPPTGLDASRLLPGIKSSNWPILVLQKRGSALFFITTLS